MNIGFLDLLSIDKIELSKRCNLHPELIEATIKDFVNHQENSLLTHDCFTPGGAEDNDDLVVVSLRDDGLDRILGGGLQPGHIIEVTGESGIGKTQFALQACLQVCMPKSQGGLGGKAIYISTESGLETKRFLQMYNNIKSEITGLTESESTNNEIILNNLFTNKVGLRTANSLENVFMYQLEPFLRQGIKLLVVDSITSACRAGGDNEMVGNSQIGKALADRGASLNRLGSQLQQLAQKHNIAVLVINQVTDNFYRERENVLSPSPDNSELFLDCQSNWLNGRAGEYPLKEGHLSTTKPSKIPALGLVWANLISTRIIMYRDFERTRRLRMVFAPYTGPAETEFGICDKGLISL